MKKLTFTLFILFSGAAMAFQGDGDAAAGKTRAMACGGCHGMDGNSLIPIYPKLAGQYSGYLIEQLQAFKAGTRQDAHMTPQAITLSDADIANVSAYFASQTMTPGATSKKYFDLGEKIYRAGHKRRNVTACIACHGPRGNGNPAARAPQIAGQYAEYTEKQLQKFSANERKGYANSDIMRDIAFRMKPEEMKAVAEYIAGLH